MEFAFRFVRIVQMPGIKLPRFEYGRLSCSLSVFAGQYWYSISYLARQNPVSCLC